VEGENRLGIVSRLLEVLGGSCCGRFCCDETWNKCAGGLESDEEDEADGAKQATLPLVLKQPEGKTCYRDKSSKCHPAISSLHVRKNTILTEP
jgi:hypothetical protein